MILSEPSKASQSFHWNILNYIKDVAIRNKLNNLLIANNNKPLFNTYSLLSIYKSDISHQPEGNAMIIIYLIHFSYPLIG